MTLVVDVVGHSSPHQLAIDRFKTTHDLPSSLTNFAPCLKDVRFDRCQFGDAMDLTKSGSNPCNGDRPVSEKQDLHSLGCFVPPQQQG